MMDALTMSQLFWLSILIIGGWTVLMCLKAVGKEVEHIEAVHRLKIEAAELRNEYRRRLRNRVEEARQRAHEAAQRRAARQAAEREQENLRKQAQDAEQAAAEGDDGAEGAEASAGGERRRHAVAA